MRGSSPRMTISCRVGKAKRAHQSEPTEMRKAVGTAQVRLCPPYDLLVTSPRVTIEMCGGRPRPSIIIILQQPLDVVELDLRPRRIGEALAQLFEDAADLLHVDLARDHLRELVIFMRAQRPP